MSEIEVYDDDLPRALQDAETLRLLQPRLAVDAVEQGEREHPNGVHEKYVRVEFR